MFLLYFLCNPLFLQFTAPVTLGILFVYISGGADAVDLLHGLELIVLLLALIVAQENYGRVFKEIGRIANHEQPLNLFSAKLGFLRAHNILGLIPLCLAILFLAKSAQLSHARPDHSPDLLESILPELYIGSLAVLYLSYCFTNRITLSVLAKTLRDQRDKLTDADYASLFMTSVGNNISFLKGENIPALVSYTFVFLFCILMAIGDWQTDDVTIFLGGAATVHLAISGVRFYNLVRDTSGETEVERDAVELLVAHMATREETLEKLQNTLSDLSAKSTRWFVVGAICMIVLTLLLLELMGFNAISPIATFL